MGETSLRVGTRDGLVAIGSPAGKTLAGHAVTALARADGGWWAVVDRRGICRSRGGDEWEQVAAVEDGKAHCLLPVPGGLLVGTSAARMLRLEDGGLRAVEPFDRVEGRDAWHTPWGGPPDTRSLCADACGKLYANVHVGGVVRSDDAGRTWRQTRLDIKADVHQVIAHPGGSLLVAASWGFGESADGGDTWQWQNRGLHARYLRAVATSNGTVFVTASRGPRGGEAAVYRRPLEGDRFEKCGAQGGLPEWFDDNIDTHCLAASDSLVAFGTRTGSVYVSRDHGATWDQVARQLSPVECLAIDR